METCGKYKDEEMESFSNVEKEVIAGEVRQVIRRLIRGCETLDIDTAFDMFLDSPDFLMMGTDGSLCNYQTYVNNNIDYLVTCSDFELTTRNEDIRILTRDVAVFSWAYKAKATLKTGEQDIVENAGATFESVRSSQRFLTHQSIGSSSCEGYRTFYR